MSRILFILDILITIPSSATRQRAVEWLVPMARTGEGYWPGFSKIAAMLSAEAASTTAFGCDTKSPNQFVTVVSGIGTAPLTTCGIVSDRSLGRAHLSDRAW